MNRHQRRALASKVRDPNGVPLTPRLLHVTERGPDGRPTQCRILYDDERIGDVLDGKRTDIHCLLVWMAEGQQGKPS